MPDKTVNSTLLKMFDSLSDYLSATNEKQRLEVVIELDEDAEKLTAFLHTVDTPITPSDFPFIQPRIPEEEAAETVPAFTDLTSEGGIPDGIAQKEEIIQERETLAEVPPPSQLDVFRVPGSRLDMLFSQIQELIFSKLAFESINKEIGEASELLHELKKNSIELGKLKSDLAAPDVVSAVDTPELTDTIYGRLEQTVSMLTELGRQIKQISGEASTNTNKLSGDLFRLMEDVKEILLTPFSNRLNVFPKMIRDISRDLGKEISFRMTGTELEIDKRILDEIKDPLVHLLRNSIDHGIESPETRAAAGKPREGKVELIISSGEGNTVQISVRDDGQGIDHEKVKNAAIKRNLLSREAASKLNRRQALDLIFASDVSTAQVITDLSGRGLGMAIVKEKVENLDGEIIVDTTVGNGTTITLSLPVYVSTLRGIIVSASGREFAIPTSKVERVMRINPEEIKTVENRETIIFNGLPIAYTELSRLLELPFNNQSDGKYKTCLVFSSAGRLSAVGIEKILDETEILLKPFAPPVKKIKNLLGTAVLGNGKLVPVINPQDIGISMEKSGGILKTYSSPDVRRREKNVLVADDSLTSRMLLKDILETNGYVVRTAVDGAEALSILRGSNFDLVVSDVEMPRMSGFALTSEIRKDPRLTSLPVILVTSLSRKEDREKGIDCGASAYIVKGSFEQSNLLDTITRLI